MYDSSTNCCSYTPISLSGSRARERRLPVSEIGDAIAKSLSAFQNPQPSDTIEQVKRDILETGARLQQEATPRVSDDYLLSGTLLYQLVGALRAEHEDLAGELNMLPALQAYLTRDEYVRRNQQHQDSIREDNR